MSEQGWTVAEWGGGTHEVVLRRPIVHRAGGMLIQAKKEFIICADLQPHDVFFYYTTTLVEYLHAPRSASG